MGETEKLDKAPKESWFTGLSAEFKKIIWPEKQSLVRQTTAVIAVSVVLGLIIALLDFAIQYGVDFLVGFNFLWRQSDLWKRHTGMLFIPTQDMRIR